MEVSVDESVVAVVRNVTAETATFVAFGLPCVPWYLNCQTADC